MPRWRHLALREWSQPALPSLAELRPCAQPLHAGIRAVPSIRSCHPPAFVAPRASRAGWKSSSITTRVGLDKSARGWMAHGAFQRMHRVCRAAGAAIAAPVESQPSPPVCSPRAGSGAIPSFPSSPLLFPIRRVWRAVGAVAGRLRVTEESRKTGAGFSSAAPCPRGAGGARRCSGSGWDQPRAGARAPGCSPEPGRAAGRDGQGGWRGTEQSKDAN